MDYTGMKPHEIQTAEWLLRAVQGCAGCHFSADVVRTICSLLEAQEIRQWPLKRGELN